MALRAQAANIAAQTGCETIEAATSLEDVFIQLMGQTQDNMA